MGFGSSAKGNFGSAFGSAAVTDGDFATAVGYGAKATVHWATALGEGTTADIAGGVALGSDSKTNITSGVLGYDPSDKITTQEILLGDNKGTYDTLQTEISTAQSNVSTLAKQILDLQDEVNTADPTRQNEIIEQIKSLSTEFSKANAALQEKISEANKLVSTWQATGAAVSVGNSETGLTRQITNVAAGSEDTDAVNVAQLKQLNNKVDEGWTLAVGRGPDAKSEYVATAEGDSKQISVGDTVTLQAGRGIKLKQDGADVQIGLKYIDMDSAGSTYNDAVASAGGALAVGQNSVADGQQGVAIGYETHAGQYSFAGGTEAEANNSSVAIGDYAKANNSGSVAIGSGIHRVVNDPTSEYRKVDSEYGVAIGYETYVGENSKNSTALGANAKLDSSKFAVAIGNNATVKDSDYATAIGHYTNVTNVINGVALGSYSIVNKGTGIVGYDASGADHSSDKTGTWKSTMGEVSIGQTNFTRQITNLAAGKENTDAVNVAQLKSVGSAGLNFKGDDGTTVVHRDLGNTLNVVGGNTDATSLTDNNIGVVADAATGTLNVKLAKNLTMGDGSITFAPTGAKDADGKTLVQCQDGKWYSDLTDATYDATKNVYTKADGTIVSAVENPVVSAVKLTDKGLDNGGNKITNVAAGTEDTDIVNLGQLKGSTIKSSDVTYAADGSGKIKLTMQDGSTVTIDNLKDTYVSKAKFENNKLTFTRNDDTSFEVGDIASKSEMDTAVKDVNLKFTGDNTDEDAVITRKNGETLSVLGGAKEFTAADNIGVVADTDKGTLNVKLAKNVSMGDGSITFAPTGAKDADGKTLVQGQDGKWYSDLTDATYDATKNVYTKADGTTVSAVENPVVSAVKLTDKGLDNGGNKITNVAAGTEDTDIVNLGQLKGSTIKSSDVTYAADGSGKIKLTMQDGSTVTIDNLKDTYVSKAKFENNKLTFTRNDDTSFEVGDIASKSEMDKAVADASLKFTGDDTSEGATITKKNAERLTIYGGVATTDADGNSLLSDVNNIGVVKTDNGLQVKLAKNLSGIDSARIGGVMKDGVLSDGIYIANQSVTYTKGDKAGKTVEGLYITGLANTAWNPAEDGIVNGRAATENQLRAAYDNVNADIKANKVLGSTNIEVTRDTNGNGTTVALKDTISLGTEVSNQVGVDGTKATITAGDGANKVAIDGTKAAITSGEGANQVAIDGTKATITAGEGANQVAVDGTKATITAGTGDNKVVVDGTAGRVTIGDESSIIVMGNQEFTVKNADGTDKTDDEGNVVKKSGKYITGLDNTSWDKANVVENRVATEGQLEDVVGNFDAKINEINNAKRGFNSDTGVTVGRGKGEILDIKGGISDRSKLTDDNIGVVNNTANSGFDVKLAKDLKDLNSVTTNTLTAKTVTSDTVTTKTLAVSEKADIGNVSISNDNVTIGTGDSQTVISNKSVTTGSVTTGNTTVDNSGVTIKATDSSKPDITLTTDAVSMGGNRIQNVGTPQDATDAINKGYLDDVVSNIGAGMNQLGNSINKLDNRVNRVGAGAAALAALHPLEYDPEAKWEISAGVGNYKSASALALGAFYRPNSDTMFSVGSSYGGGENMVNAGVTLRVGAGETLKYSSKREMAQKINDLETVVADQKGELTDLKSVVAEQKDRIEELTQLVNTLINK